LASRRALKIAAGVSVSFTCIAFGIIYLGAMQIVTPAAGLLMLVALLGLYVGFGILIGVYQLISKLE